MSFHIEMIRLTVSMSELFLSPHMISEPQTGPTRNEPLMCIIPQHTSCIVLCVIELVEHFTLFRVRFDVILLGFLMFLTF
jgi:hypothetical protein